MGRLRSAAQRGSAVSSHRLGLPHTGRTRGLCPPLAGCGCRPHWTASTVLLMVLSLRGQELPPSQPTLLGPAPLGDAQQPLTRYLAEGLRSRVPKATPLPPVGYRQLRCHHPTPGSPLRSPRGDRVAPPLRRQRPHSSHQHGSAARPLRRGQRGFPFPATPLGTLPQVTAPAACRKGPAGARVPTAAPSLPPAAGQGASPGDKHRNLPHHAAPRATQRYQRRQPASPSLWP